jgi:hypothetical protein
MQAAIHNEFMYLVQKCYYVKIINSNKEVVIMTVW